MTALPIAPESPRPTAPAPGWVPVLPDSAPFTAEQRAYLNGFLAGLFSYAPASNPPAANPLQTLTVLFASQTGTAEKLAKRVVKTAAARGFAPTLHDLARYPREQLPNESHVLIIASTYGDGDPPDSARGFWQWLESDQAPRLSNLNFSVCALGDSNYPRFCAFGKKLDARLETLGAQRTRLRVDCDVDHEADFAAWLAESLRSLSARNGSSAKPTAQAQPSAIESQITSSIDSEPSGPSREHPFPARLKTNRRLSAEGSDKEVRHFEIDLSGSGITYEAGDALGVWPSNPPVLVDAVLGHLGCRGHESVPLPDGTSASIREALVRTYELTRIPKPLLQYYAAKTQDPSLQRLTSPNVNGELTDFLRGRDVLDLLQAHSTTRPTPTEFIACLRRLQPRLYSISSSPKVTPTDVHLTVSVVRYEAHGRSRQGVASTFLADHVSADQPVPVFLHSNPAFRPPAPDRPLIMVGPGTGIAPFRAFLLDRRASSARGRNWLFFGDRHAATDFLYRDEIEGFLRDGTLHRLDLAWSRDGQEKVYVQDRMRAEAAALWSWLQDGACFCVCGDASRMAKDVDTALLEVIQTAGGLGADAAAAYVDTMRAEGRYCRDVY